MIRKEIAKSYLRFLEKGDVEGIISLFSSNGVVISPVYGKKNVVLFYKELFSDTLNSKLDLYGIFEEAESEKIAIYFNYTWTLKNRKKVTFDVVDILDFDGDYKIKELRIIYDTVASRALVANLKDSK